MEPAISPKQDQDEVPPELRTPLEAEWEEIKEQGGKIYPIPPNDRRFKLPDLKEPPPSLLCELPDGLTVTLNPPKFLMPKGPLEPQEFLANAVRKLSIGTSDSGLDRTPPAESPVTLPPSLMMPSLPTLPQQHHHYYHYEQQLQQLQQLQYQQLQQHQRLRQQQQQQLQHQQLQQQQLQHQQLREQQLQQQHQQQQQQQQRKAPILLAFF